MSVAAVGVAAVAVSLLIVSTFYRLRLMGGFLFDFRGDLYDPARAILQGRDPYDPHFLASLAAAMRAGRPVSHAFALAVYPAPSLLAAIPFAFVGFVPAGITFQGLMVAAMVGGLRLLGVRDWRCIVLALVSWPFLFGLDVGALGPVVVLGIGVAWRLRARLWGPALAIASIVVAKLFPWTLVAWLVVTRRFKALALTLVIGAALLIGGWAVIGFAGLADYPRMLSDLSFVERDAGVSLVTALMTVGVPGGLSEVISLMVALMIIAIAYRFVRRANGEAQALGLAVIAALIASPIVWPHYFVLLFVPIALTSPRLSPLWLLPLPTVLIVDSQTKGLLGVVPWLLLIAAVGIALCRREASAERRERLTQRRGAETATTVRRPRLAASLRP
jgi:hypothetical protein